MVLMFDGNNTMREKVIQVMSLKAFGVGTNINLYAIESQKIDRRRQTRS